MCQIVRVQPRKGQTLHKYYYVTKWPWAASIIIIPLTSVTGTSSVCAGDRQLMALLFNLSNRLTSVQVSLWARTEDKRQHRQWMIYNKIWKIRSNNSRNWELVLISNVYANDDMISRCRLVSRRIGRNKAALLTENTGLENENASAGFLLLPYTRETVRECFRRFSSMWQKLIYQTCKQNRKIVISQCD